MKAILISINPKYVAKILNGEKTIEIRKTMPKCDLPIDVYIYCSKGGKKDWHLIEVVDTETSWEGYEYDYYIGGKGYLKHCLEGKVVAKFTLNKVEEIGMWNYSEYGTRTLMEESLCIYSCLDCFELKNYIKNKPAYAWHISNLVIFDKPKELSEFKTYKRFDCYNADFDYTTIEYRQIRLTKAPKSWQFVESEK